MISTLFASAAALLRRRWPEIAAVLRWTFRSWLHPGDSDSEWEQGSG